jgi:hypothetical protein
MTINNLPGAVWPILFGAIYAGLQVFVSAQWPDAPPATVLGLMTALGVAMGAVKVLWPQTPAATPPDGAAAAPRGLAAPEPPKAQPSKMARVLI